MAQLKVNNIRKSFGNVDVLKGIDFELNKGEVLAIIGSSGSGKTTLLRCLNFLETPDTGTIEVGGETLFDANEGISRDENEIRLKRLHFGLVFQSFNLFPQYTVEDNISLPAKLLVSDEIDKLKKQQKAYRKEQKLSLGSYLKCISAQKSEIIQYKANRYREIEDKTARLLERVGLTAKAQAYPYQLSGGQQQRVAIARALSLSPDILCFDEPTSALDPELTGEVLKVIRGLKSKDNTMIVVTHEMKFAREVADKVIFMADGVIEEEGTPDEVFGNPKSQKTRAFLSMSQDTVDTTK